MKKGSWWIWILVALLLFSNIYFYYKNTNSISKNVYNDLNDDYSTLLNCYSSDLPKCTPLIDKYGEKDEYKHDTYFVNLTQDNINTFIEDDDLMMFLYNKDVETMCLKACGKQCTELGFTYKSSSYVYQKVIDEWCICSCNE